MGRKTLCFKTHSIHYEMVLILNSKMTIFIKAMAPSASVLPICGAGSSVNGTPA